MDVRRVAAAILTAGALVTLTVVPASAAPAQDGASAALPPAGCATAIAAAVDSANAAAADAADAADVADSAAAAAAAKAFAEGVLTGTPTAINAAANLAAFNAAAAAAAYATSAGATVAVLVACAQA
jgi:hypothetical protein